MARALMMEPSVLLLDEPSAGLSPVRQDETFLRTRRINKTGVCVVMVEQNARRCLQICDRGYVLDQGRDAYTGTGRELANDPKVIELYLGTLAKDVEEEHQPTRHRPSRPGVAGRQAQRRRAPDLAVRGLPLLRSADIRDQERALHRAAQDVLVVGVEVVDADERRRRVVLVVDRTDARRTGVPDLLAVLEQRDAVGVGVALLAVGGTRDGGEVLLDRLRSRSTRPSPRRARRGWWRRRTRRRRSSPSAPRPGPPRTSRSELVLEASGRGPRRGGCPGRPRGCPGSKSSL